MKASKAERRARRKKGARPYLTPQQRAVARGHQIPDTVPGVDEAHTARDARWAQICRDTAPGTKNAYIGRELSPVPHTQARHTCAHVLTTVHRDPGVTPVFLACREPDCKGELVSTNYAFTDRTPTHEWYQPSDVELARLNPRTREHVAQGGLLLRPITEGATS